MHVSGITPYCSVQSRSDRAGAACSQGSEQPLVILRGLELFAAAAWLERAPLHLGQTLNRVFAVRLLECPHCGGRRKLIALIRDGPFDGIQFLGRAPTRVNLKLDPIGCDVGVRRLSRVAIFSAGDAPTIAGLVVLARYGED